MNYCKINVSTELYKAQLEFLLGGLCVLITFNVSNVDFFKLTVTVMY